MLIISKAQEIQKTYHAFTQRVIDEREYQNRVSSILASSYMPHNTGITEAEEENLLKELVDKSFITQNIYIDQINKIKRAAVFGYEESMLPAKEKKSYVGPIIMCFIGGMFCAFIVTLIIGIPLVIIGCVLMAKRHSYNTSISVVNELRRERGLYR